MLEYPHRILLCGLFIVTKIKFAKNSQRMNHIDILNKYLTVVDIKTAKDLRINSIYDYMANVHVDINHPALCYEGGTRRYVRVGMRISQTENSCELAFGLIIKYLGISARDIALWITSKFIDHTKNTPTK